MDITEEAAGHVLTVALKGRLDASSSKTVEERILKLIEEDEDIALLILAASSGTEGPGPLVSSLAKTAGTFPIPVAIVPGHLSDEDLESMS